MYVHNAHNVVLCFRQNHKYPLIVRKQYISIAGGFIDTCLIFILILTVRLYIILNNKYCLRKQQLIIGSIVAEELREVVLIENQFIFGCVVFY